MTTYTFTEKVDLTGLAKRVIDTADFYNVLDVFGTEENATQQIADDLIHNPLAIIESLVETIEELQEWRDKA